MRYPLIAAQLFNTALMAQPAMAHAFADAFIAILSGSASVEARFVSTDGAALETEASASRYAGSRFKDKPYAMTDSGIGILPVHGAMVQRMGQITPDCTEMTSYEKLGRRFDAMLSDPDVKAILMDIDSPGGQVAGNFEFARRILAARDQKPVYAHANEKAYSAAYSIGSSAAKLFTNDTGGVGSIGVMMLHMNMAERDAKLGYEYHAFHSGARKNDFNPHFKLSAEAKASAMATVNQLHNVFAQHVATARGVSVDAVNATQSDTLDAGAALDGKFIDGIATFGEIVSMIEDSLKNQSQFGLRPSAGRSSTATQPAQEISMNFTQQDIDKAVALATTALEMKHADAVAQLTAKHKQDLSDNTAEAIKASKERSAAILALPEAKDRPLAARQIADATDMSVEKAKEFLASLPIEKGAGGFGSAMAGLKNPPVSGGDGGAAAEDLDAVAQRIASFARRDKS